MVTVYSLVLAMNVNYNKCCFEEKNKRGVVMKGAIIKKEKRQLKKAIKKAVAGIAAATMVMTMAVPTMAANQVVAAFIHAGTSEAKTVDQGANVTAPAVPEIAGYTFCGYDKSLKNIQVNTVFNAVYVPTAVGDTVIAATKASLPTPAVTATTVADPNAAAAATSSDAATQQLLQLIAAQAANAQQAAQTALTPATETTPTATTGPVLTAPALATGLPSWVVGLEGVSASGAATAYNYLKNTKGLDDATIQANWASFMHHYAEYGTQGW